MYIVWNSSVAISVCSYFSGWGRCGAGRHRSCRQSTLKKSSEPFTSKKWWVAKAVQPQHSELNRNEHAAVACVL